MTPLEHVREICAALPETCERPSHGVPAFFVRNKKVVVMYVESEGGGLPAMWCPAPEDVQQELVRSEPDRFFVPPYVGRSGWIGVRLDVDVCWDEVAAIVRDAYRLVAPKLLVRELEQSS